MASVVLTRKYLIYSYSGTEIDKKLEEGCSPYLLERKIRKKSLYCLLEVRLNIIDSLRPPLLSLTPSKWD